MSESKVPLPEPFDNDRYFKGHEERRFDLWIEDQMRSYGDARAAEANAAKDAAYEERNRVVALLAALLPSIRTRTAIEGWSDDWHGCVYITLPDGSQASWHFHDSQAHLFAHVPEGTATWDGHTTPEKYARIERCITARPNIAAEARRLALLEAADIADQEASIEGIAQRIRDRLRALADEASPKQVSG